MTSAPPGLLNSGSGFGLAVTAYYDSGAVDSGFNGSVTVTVSNGPSGEGLGGTTTAAAVGGVLSAGGDYTLQIGSADAAVPLDVAVSVASAPKLPPAGPGPGAPAAPVITGQSLIFAGKGKQKRLVGLQLVYSGALDPSSAVNPANYAITQTIKNRRAKTAQAIRLRVAYDDATKTVSLTIIGKPKFASGGQLMVRSQAGDAQIFAIRPGGRGIVP
jgi:hypothetical protein